MEQACGTDHTTTMCSIPPYSGSTVPKTQAEIAVEVPHAGVKSGRGGWPLKSWFGEAGWSWGKETSRYQAGEMARWLRALNALLEDRGLVPSTHNR